MATCFSTGRGTNWSCFRSSVRRPPRESWAWVALSSSEPNWAKAASSRYCASSSRSAPATCFMALIWRLPATPLTARPRVLGRLHPLRHRRALLADGHVDADDVAALLVQDGVEDDGGLAGLAVADDELALAAPDGDHGVHGLDTGLQRLAHRLALEHARGQALQRVELVGGDGPLAVDRLPEGAGHAPHQRFAHRHRPEP